MVVFFGFYDDFARYFYLVRNNLNQMNIRSYLFSNNLSGWLYWFLRKSSSSWLAMSVFFQNPYNFYKYIKLLSYKDIDYMIEYYHYLYEGKYDYFLKIKSKLYFAYIYNWSKKNNAKVFFISGDSRLICRAAIIVAKKLKIKKLFFEQGPYNTTLIDNQGVNSNFSFRTSYPHKKHNKIAKFDYYHQNFKYKRNLLYRTSDYILSLFLPKILFPECQDNLLKRIKSLIKNNKQSIVSYTRGYAVLILQVPEDANMLLHSPHYDNFSQLAEDLRNSLPPSMVLIIREHPLHKGSYGSKLYNLINHSNIILDNVTNLEELIKGSSIVILNNSTVAFTVIRHQKPLLVTGDAYYDKSNVVTKLKNHINLKKNINKALNIKLSKQKTINFFNILGSYLISSHYRDGDIDCLSLRTAILIKKEYS